MVSLIVKHKFSVCAYKLPVVAYLRHLEIARSCVVYIAVLIHYRKEAFFCRYGKVKVVIGICKYALAVHKLSAVHIFAVTCLPVRLRISLYRVDTVRKARTGSLEAHRIHVCNVV